MKKKKKEKRMKGQVRPANQSSLFPDTTTVPEVTEIRVGSEDPRRPISRSVFPKYPVICRMWTDTKYYQSNMTM
jgi:hypothetical protein